MFNKQKYETSSILFFVAFVFFCFYQERRLGRKATEQRSVNNKTHGKHGKPDLGSQPLSCRQWEKCDWASILEGLFKEDELETFIELKAGSQFRRLFQAK